MPQLKQDNLALLVCERESVHMFIIYTLGKRHFNWGVYTVQIKGSCFSKYTGGTIQTPLHQSRGTFAPPLEKATLAYIGVSACKADIQPLQLLGDRPLCWLSSTNVKF